MKNYYSALLLILLIACAESEEKKRTDVRAVVAGIIDADNHADLERVLSYYHGEAILMPPGKPEIKGTDNIRKNYENIFANSIVKLLPEEDEIIILKNNAIYKGRTKGKVEMKADATEREVNDKFIMILQQNDGEWKIIRLIWN